MNHEHHWRAVEGNSETTRNRIIPDILEHGRILKTCRPELEVVRYPAGPLQFQIHRKTTDESVVAAHPCCHEGRPNRIKIRKIMPAPYGCAATISGASRGGAAIDFFDTDFALNRERYKIGEEFDFLISGIVLAIEPTEKAAMLRDP